MPEPDDNLGSQPGGDHAFAVAQAARAMSDAGLDGRDKGNERWIDRLEREVRLSFAEGANDREVAHRLVAWTEEALEDVPEPVMRAARGALVDHAFEAQDAESGHLRGFAAALRSVMEADEARRYEDALRQREADARVQANPQSRSENEHERNTHPGPNRIDAGGGAEGAQAIRQIAQLAELVADPTGTVAKEVARAGLLGRLRGVMDRSDKDARSRQADDGTGHDPGDDLPASLKKRYAVHVSEDRRTIQLFEPGAKTPSITLDARSISTPHNEGAVIADLATLARDRGWQALKVEGTAEFRDAIWLEASKLGLTVSHVPSSAVQAAYRKWDRDRPDNLVKGLAVASGQGASPSRDEELGARFVARSAEERLADPRLRNAQLELMVGIRTAEKELGRPIAEMPEVRKALTAAIREQLVTGRVFDAPFVRPEAPRSQTKRVQNPRIDADRIPPPRP